MNLTCHNGKHLDLTNFLQNELHRLGITTPAPFFLQYLSLLTKWNRAYNLTAIRDIENMVSHHLLDSLAVIPWLKGERLLDVGSGAGLPGIPLAIALPHCHVVLLDSNGKKIRFLQTVQRTLALSNIQIVQTRVENYVDPQGFDIVISRAFSNLKKMMGYTKHLLTTQGRWLAMKGHYPATELASISNFYRVEKYHVAGVEGQRCCVIIKG